MTGTKHQASIEVVELDERAMFLWQEMAEGEYEGKEFKVMAVIPGSAVFVEFDDTKYQITVQTLVEAVLGIRDKRDEEKGKGT